MITCKINDVPILFIRGFTPADVSTIMNFVRNADDGTPERRDTVLFIDCPETLYNVEAVQKLKDEGYRVAFRDHHEIEGESITESDRTSISVTAKLRQILGADCLITNRRLHPACSTLVQVGEFKDALAIIADPDADGLTAAMKAAGISYDGLDDDAAKLDGEPASQVTGTEIASLLAKGMATLPIYDPQNPHQREKLQEQLFIRWVAAVGGNTKAIAQLHDGVAAYDAAVLKAQQLSCTAQEVAPGVILVDTSQSELYDVGTLTSLLEAVPGCRITVLRRSNGPIAALHQIQYSLAVAKAYQSRINLKHLLPPHFKSDLREGIITNVPFLLHASPDKWQEYVLPALRQLSCK